MRAFPLLIGLSGFAAIIASPTNKDVTMSRQPIDETSVTRSSASLSVGEGYSQRPTASLLLHSKISSQPLREAAFTRVKDIEERNLLDHFAIDKGKSVESYSEKDKHHDWKEPYSKDWLSLGNGYHTSSSDAFQTHQPFLFNPQSMVPSNSQDRATDEEGKKREDTEEEEEKSSTGSRRKGQIKDQQKLWLEWDKHKLGTHLPAKTLAQMASTLHVEGVVPHIIGSWIKQRLVADLKAGRIDYKYYSDYCNERKRFSQRISKWKRKMARKDPTFKEQDESTKLAQAYEAMIQADEGRERDLSPEYRSPSDKRKLDRTNEKTAIIGQDIEQYFARHGVDYTTMSLSSLEKATRGRSLANNGNKTNYTFHLIRYFQQKLPNFDADVFRHLRDEHIRTFSNKRRIRSTRRAHN